MTHSAHATPEQAATLQSLLLEWNDLLHTLEQNPHVPRQTLVSSRTILGNYRRRLQLDLQSGLEHLPAAELTKAITVARASLQQLSALRRNTGAG